MEPFTPCSLSLFESLPTELRAGDAHTWTVSTDLPPGSSVFFVLTAVIANQPHRLFIPAAGATASVAVDTNGIAAFSVDSATSRGWAAGRYKWVIFGIDNTGNRVQLAQGTVQIVPDVAGAVVVDPRSYNERMLDQIRSVLANNAMDDVGMYKIGGRELTKVPRKELMDQEAHYEARVRREQRRKAGKSIYRNAPITFGGRC